MVLAVDSCRGSDRHLHGGYSPLVFVLSHPRAGFAVDGASETYLFPRIDRRAVPGAVVTRAAVHRLAADDLAADVLRQARDVLGKAIDCAKRK